MSTEIDSKVIGYYAFSSSNEVICDGDACVIAGSEKAMSDYLELVTTAGSTKPKVKKTRFIEIIRGMEMGAPYAFDEQSYSRFYPLANRIGYGLKEEEFSVPTETGHHFVVIRL